MGVVRSWSSGDVAPNGFGGLNPRVQPKFLFLFFAPNRAAPTRVPGKPAPRQSNLSLEPFRPEPDRKSVV